MAAISRPSGKVFALKDNKSLFPYLLLAPGLLWLFMFFILPIVNLAQTSTQTPILNGDIGQYEQTFRFANYLDAFLENREQFSRSFIYAIIATLLALLISYPLAYALAFKAGKYKNILLVLVVAPFHIGDAVNISWEPIFTFALRGDEDAEAGTEVMPEDLDEE